MHTDVNLGYNIRPNLAFFINMRNVARVFQRSMRTSDELADYAQVANTVRWEGITSNFGIRGSF